ncbi:DUF5753 domain-containing protein [Kitasatospora sp. NPDC048545]|uniref:DUF5753 domain-containing protein n=1 Tax=Kitasatospora sp. NPDC048545 TaxID=3157208 RepID=UPI0033CB9AC3
MSNAKTISWEGGPSGLGAVQRVFLDLAENTAHYSGYHPSLIWGNIQNPTYVRAVFENLRAIYSITDEEVEVAVQARIERGKFLGRPGYIYEVVMGEQALLTPIGGRDVQRGQLERLIAELDTPGLRLGVIPARAAVPIHSTGGFSIFSDQQQSGGRVETEDLSGLRTITAPDAVANYRAVHAMLRQAALYGADARALIEQVLDET